MAARVSVCLISAFLFAGATVFSQGPRDAFPQMENQGTDLRGEIIHDHGVRLDNLFVEVQPVGGAGLQQRVPVDPTGGFMLSGLGPSTYVLRVTDMYGNAVVEQVVSPASMGFIQIKLPHENIVRPPKGTVSLFELGHKIPSNALKEAKAADNCLVKTHDMACYIAHVQKAVDLDPDYLTARRNLAIAYLKAGDAERVVAESQELLKRDSHSFVAYAVSAVAYLQLRDFASAEHAARQALALDSADVNCRYYLGVSLQLQHKDDAEALELLEKSAARYPKAHLSAAEILERTGQKSAAKGQLEEYLKSDEKDVREDVKKWISSLN